MNAIFLVVIFLITISVIPSYAITTSCNCVVFRLDDIQDYWLNDVQTKIIDTFQQKNASLTVGIIGNHIGQDSKITDYIKSRLATENPAIEIANHGWNHEDFTQFSKEQQSILMKNTNDKIHSIFGITPSVFIPPYNAINSDTMAAFLENNFKYISANTTEDTPSYFTKNIAVYHFPGTAKTGNLNDDNTYWYSENHKQTFVEIADSMQKYGYAIVVMHPQEYSIRQSLNYSDTIDDNQIHELELLIDEVRADGLKIVTISDIPKHITNQKIPDWVSNLFIWYNDGQISENDVYNAIKFLMSWDMMKFDDSFISYPIHENITTTVFWVGESASHANECISNAESTWDYKWLEHFGGVDNPKLRNGFMPAKFVPHENPFYFALPYTDFDDNGIRKSNAYKVVYWANHKNWTDSESMVKNTWIKITKGDKTVYAQWEDAGPFVYDDYNYVFGNNLPTNKVNNNSGLDVSPAVRDFIDLYGNNHNVVNWQFVNFDQVPDGPWKQIITTSQISQPDN